MLTYLIQRFGQALVTVAAMATLVFVGVYAIADPIDMLAAPDATPDERAAIGAQLGLDRSLPVQFGTFAWRALHGDLGRSFVYNEPALSVILQRLPATLELALTALVLAVAVGLPLGLWAGLKPSSGSGRTIMTGSILAFSLPNFWQGLMLVLVFAVTLGWFPAGGRGETVNVLGIETGLLTLDGLRHLVLPAVNLALFKLAVVIRLARAGTREAMLQDYVRFARAKGLSPARIVGVHVLKNILLPVVTVIGLELGSMIAFAVVTETVFAWPGIGKLLIDSINRLDRPVIVAYLMLTVCLFVAINLIVDLIYAALDPRVRLSEAA
ncbi:ABC transporter permease [Methylobacterium sp. WL30]|uniref:ABC transporter permease n=1 Tax=unclassified Methylobacterium TaxID=2615210 RepID=UPI0011CB0ADA|nr:MULTISPECIES: ABC transporter permease [unclassified Methylobacterium]TXM89089.1 ABC transporter permease [Methylobacterium sp. WL116]TXN22551.1 ABC transporter permease [Methylobacterium sp. WL93]TXN44545.1 ABC transporter permease [Methylobacterium sp. WL119]TXN63084.1 ABC transporter permease [Methylobacterium sp. WL30]